MSLLQLASMARTNSSSMQHLVQVPANLLEAFIPGYGTISRVLLETFSIDITMIVSVSFFAFALFRSIGYLQSQVLMLVMRFGTCSIEVSGDADSYFWIMDWLADRGIGKDSHHLTAITARQYARWSPDDDLPDLPLPQVSSRKVPKSQRYEPALDQTHYFWFKGQLFRWQRFKENKHDRYRRIGGRLYCLSRTTAPIKALVDEASAQYHKKRSHNTTICRPAPRHQRRNGMNLWKTVAMRPSRPLHTVVLGCEQKDLIISDIEEYLQPNTRQWYAVRGIPYRRGYLFHGNSGTGKTSLSCAIAGVFGLDVYCVSLAEPSITEEDLVSMFDELPEQCMVLLEDIDSAGIVVRDRKMHDTNGVQQLEMFTETDINPSSHMTGITLSGLLNVIDGIASQEGRILIMTTNHVNALDDALLRPGRVDLRIKFELASKKQAEDLFMQTFSDKVMEDPETTQSIDVKDEALEEMACTFAAIIPDRSFSPADIQGFLMNWKKKPADAVAKVREWVEEGMKKKNDELHQKLINDERTV